MKSLSSLIIFVIAFAGLASANAANPREELKQLTAQLQSNPGDTALREKIIKLAQTIKPTPAVPEVARAHFVEGTAIAKSARSPAQQTLAVQSFQEALKIAPWWGDAYYNLAVAQELAGQFDSAQASLKLYILTGPGEKNVREAQDRIYALNAKKKMAAADQNSPEAVAERDRKFLQSLEGAVWLSAVTSLPIGDRIQYGRSGFIVRNGQLLLMESFGWYPGEVEPSIESRKVWESISLTGKRLSVNLTMVRDPSCNPTIFQISDDGNLLTQTSSCYGRIGTNEYTRRR